MCDYSLHAYPNRLAVDGEDLIIHRFGGTSLGLASPADVCQANPETKCSANRGLWASIKTWFAEQRQLEKPIPAVCIPPGARLILKDIPKSLQRELGVGEIEEVRFVETSAEVNTYRDAVRFGNCRQILLQSLREGQRVTVLELDPAESENALVWASREYLISPGRPEV